MQPQLRKGDVRLPANRPINTNNALIFITYISDWYSALISKLMNYVFHYANSKIIFEIAVHWKNNIDHITLESKVRG